MKKLLLFAIAFMLFSCSSGDDETRNTENSSDKILLLSVKKNGVLLQKFNYDNNGNLLETLFYNNEGYYSGKYVTEYEGGKPKKRVNYDNNNVSLGYLKFTLNGSNIIKEEEYSSNNVKQSETTYLYDNSGYKIESNYLYGLRLTKYSYINEHKYEYDIYKDGNKVTHAVNYTDDKNGLNNFPWYGKANNHNVVQTDYNFYDSGNNESRYSTFTYNSNGFPIKEVTNKTGSIINTFEYEWSK